MRCTVCDEEVSVLFMCDQEVGEQRCQACFEKTDCGQGLHEEDCQTVINE